MINITPNEFYQKTNGQVIDYDKMYGGQCWDLFSYFSSLVFGRAFSCVVTGYVGDLYNYFEQCGLTDYYQKISGYEGLQDGDWCIWTTPTPNVTNSSHIAMFRYDNKDGTGMFLTQDPGTTGTNPTIQRTISYNNITGYLRPKIYIKYNKIVEIVQENNKVDQVKVNVIDLRVRNTTNTTDDNTILGLAVYNGIYNCYEIKNDNGYNWYKISENQWIASVNNSLTYLPKTNKNEKVEIEEEQNIYQTSTNDETINIVKKEYNAKYFIKEIIKLIKKFIKTFLN